MLRDRHFYPLLVAGAIMLGFNVPAAEARGQLPNQTQHVPSEGADLFQTACATCHGGNGEGGIGPKLRTEGLTVPEILDVLKRGRPGTMMQRFLGRYSSEQLELVAAYVATPVVSRQERLAPRIALTGNPLKGEKLFFGFAAHRCAGCHTIDGRGRPVGPELTSRLAGLTAQQLVDRIINPGHREAESSYRAVRLRTRGGRLITGVLASESGERLRIYDTSTLPAVLLEIPRREVISVQRLNESVMPNDYAARLTLQQLADLVAFLRERP